MARDDSRAEARYAVADALARAESPAEIADVVVREAAAAADARTAELSTATTPACPAAADALAGAEVWLTDADARRARYPGWAAEPADGVQAWAALPVAVTGGGQPRSLGALVLGFARPQGFDADQRAELRGLARLIAIALDRADLLERQRATARFADEQLGVFAHDLRSPLGAISLTADTLLTAQPEPTARKRFELILRSTKRMERMVNQLVDYGRARLGTGLPMTVDEADLGVLARVAVEDARARTGRAVELAIDGDARGTWDPERISQAVANLIGNAAEHGGAGEAVRVHVDGGAADRVRLTVWNAGAIEPAVLAEVFAPFRGGRPRTKTSGLGLGLHLACAIAEAHGGRVDVRSTPDEGTTFTLELPRRSST